MPTAPAISNKKFVEQIPVKLTPEELIMKGRELARLGSQVEEKRAEAKSVAAGFKAEIDTLEDQQSKLIREINAGEETRPIECFERPRYADLIADIIRTDLGTVWRQRAMHPSERQLAIEVGDAAPVDLPSAATSKAKKKKPAPPQAETNESAH